jgi:transcriptional regulator with XRE-family HTH domain
MAENATPQMPQRAASAAPQAPTTPVDLRYAAELIKAVGGDIAQLALNQNEELDQLESLVKQIAYVREVLDYGLFVSPDQVERQEDLYPFSAWLQRKFGEISKAISEQGKQAKQAQLSEQSGISPSALEALFRAEVAKLNDTVNEANEVLHRTVSALISEQPKAEIPLDGITSQLREQAESADGKLNEIFEYLHRLENRHDEQFRAIRAQVDAVKEQNTLSPYDDFDVQVEELRIYLKEETARWRIQENIFFGAVIMMLFINMGMVLWLNMTS